jgi:hypothetical protein
MAGERRINFGADATDAKYRLEHDTTNGKYVLAEDLDGGTVLLEWDESANSGAGGWVSRGAVDLNGNDLSGVGTLTSAAVSTDNVGNGGSPVSFEDRPDLPVVASGSTSISANGVAALDTNSQYGSGGYTVLLSATDGDTTAGRAVVKLGISGGNGDPQWVLEETKGDPIDTVNWKIVQLA